MNKQFINWLAFIALFLVIFIIASCSDIPAVNADTEPIMSGADALKFDPVDSTADVTKEPTQSEQTSSEQTKAQSTVSSATTEEQIVSFNITPAQDSILSEIFGSSYIPISGKWSYWFEKSLTAEDASVWNTEAPSDIFDVLGYLSNNDRFYRVWTATPSLSSDAKTEYIIVSPEQDSIITELVDEKYKCYSGYWDIWFYKILNSKQIDDWNYSVFTTHDTIRQFMQDKSISTKLENLVPIYQQ